MKKFVLVCFAILLTLGFAGCGVSSEKVQESICQEVIDTSEAYGLSNVSVNVTGGGKFNGYKVFYLNVSCSNFESLSYEQIFNLDSELDEIRYPDVLLVMGNYKSGEDTWSILRSIRTIEKNGIEMYNDYENSEIFKYAQENTDKSGSNGTPVTDSSLKIDVWVCAQDIVEGKLKSPSSADFCSVIDASVYSNGSNNYTVVGYVDAENSFGAIIRNDFIVTLTFTGSGYKNGVVTFS